MATPPRTFQNGSYFHIYNRGVEKRKTFLDDADYRRFLASLAFYQQAKVPTRYSLADFKPADRAEPLRFEILSYCLMPNHFHLLVRQIIENGISTGLGLLLNSYTKYFNTRYERVGHLFQGRFQAVPVRSDEQLIHLARYIFLNPYVSNLTQNLSTYSWSAYREYLDLSRETLCHQDQLLRYFSGKEALRQFTEDYADYGRSLELVKKLVID